jgi:hypothetical protein
VRQPGHVGWSREERLESWGRLRALADDDAFFGVVAEAVRLTGELVGRGRIRGRDEQQQRAREDVREGREVGDETATAKAFGYTLRRRRGRTFGGLTRGPDTMQTTNTKDPTKPLPMPRAAVLCPCADCRAIPTWEPRTDASQAAVAALRAS